MFLFSRLSLQTSGLSKTSLSSAKRTSVTGSALLITLRPSSNLLRICRKVSRNSVSHLVRRSYLNSPVRKKEKRSTLVLNFSWPAVIESYSLRMASTVSTKARNLLSDSFCTEYCALT